MKKIALLLFVPLVFSCASYEPATIVDATPMYKDKRSQEKITTIPGNTEVMLAGKRDVKKVKYNGQEGFVVKPNYASHTIVKKTVAPKKRA
jgi:hypothetical protein